MIPHGMSVILHSPAVFRFTAPTNPALHLCAARLMGVDTRGAAPEDAGDLLAGAIVDLMRRTGIPNGLRAVGYGPPDVDRLVAGTLPQHRVTKLSPRPASAEDLKQLFLNFDEPPVEFERRSTRMKPLIVRAVHAIRVNGQGIGGATP